MKSRSTNIKRSSLSPYLLKENENGIRLKIYIQGHMIGAGKMKLLHLVHQKRSIRAAANFMGMSTKRAQFLLNTIEEAFSTAILEKQKGNQRTLLTSFGKELLAKYLSLNKHLSEEAEDFIIWAASKRRKN